jgi:uncharacterized RDD family membrane protein YckC
MATKMYYVVENGKQNGPFSIDDLIVKQIKPDTLVWFDGLEKWKRANDIPELVSVFKKSPPPIDFIEEDAVPHEFPPIPNFAEEKADNMKLASIPQRFLGYILTLIFTLIVYVTIFKIFHQAIDVLYAYVSSSFFRYVLFAGVSSQLLNGIFYPFFAGNIGHYIMGLKVVHVYEGQQIPVYSLFTGMRREMEKGILGLVLIPVIWLLFDKKRQNIYDKIEGTIVVKSK